MTEIQCSYQADGADRIVTCRCASEGCSAPVFDGCAQTMGRDGEWHPSIDRILIAMGWIVGVDGQAFCSRRCAAHYEYATRGLRPVVAVTKIHDASYAPTPRPVAAIQAARARANVPEKTR